VCESFSVSIDGGFLPDEIAVRLEAEGVQVWEQLIDALPQLNRRGRLVRS
jgi:hypothetical protein